MQVQRRLGCACAPRQFGALGATPPVYLFYLDTKGGTASPGGPYSYMQVPPAYYGQMAIPMPNAPPDANVLNAANAGSAAGAIQVRWYGSQVQAGTLNSLSVPSDGNASINSANAAGTANNIIYTVPPQAVMPQATDIAASVGGPILVGVVAQSTSPLAFQKASAPSPSSPVAPIVQQTSPSNTGPQPVATMNDYTPVVSTALPVIAAPSNSGLSFGEIALILSLATLLFL